MDSGRGASITRPDNVEDREVAYMGGRILIEDSGYRVVPDARLGPRMVGRRGSNESRREP